MINVASAALVDLLEVHASQRVMHVSRSRLRRRVERRAGSRETAGLLCNAERTLGVLQVLTCQARFELLVVEGTLVGQSALSDGHERHAHQHLGSARLESVLCAQRILNPNSCRLLQVFLIITDGIFSSETWSRQSIAQERLLSQRSSQVYLARHLSSS